MWRRPVTRRTSCADLSPQAGRGASRATCDSPASPAVRYGVECGEAALAVDGRSAREIFGSPDDLKLRSSATLFAQVSAPGSVFHRLLDKYFAGEPDEATLRLIRANAASSARRDP